MQGLDEMSDSKKGKAQIRVYANGGYIHISSPQWKDFSLGSCSESENLM